MDNKAYGYLKSSEQNHMKTLEQYVKDKRSIVTDEKSSRDGYNYLKNHMLRKGDIHKTYWALTGIKPPKDQDTLIDNLVRNEAQNKSYGVGVI